MDDIGNSPAGDGAEGPAKSRKRRFRWGKVVYEEDDTAGQSDVTAGEQATGAEAPEDRAEAPGQRVFRERRKKVLRRHTRLKVALGVSLATLAVLLLDIAVKRMEEDVLTAPPMDIMGTWVTDDPRYEDRGFVISAEQFELRLGDGQSSRHVIRSIERVEIGDTWEYEIIYGSPEGDLSFVFFLRPGEILQLKNPPEVVWRREPSGRP